MKELSGVPVSPGIAIGKAFLFRWDDFPEIKRWTITKTQVEDEWQRLMLAVANLSSNLKSHIASAEREANKEQSAILKAHLLMLEDVDFQDQVRRQLGSELQNIEWTVWNVSQNMAQKLLSAPSAYLRERAIDISDMARQLLNKLLSINQVSLAGLTEDVIVVSRDLLPSQAVNMNKAHVKALAMDTGSATSHTAILARSFDIPAVLGLSAGTKAINSGDILIVDGNNGKVFIQPDEATLEKYKSELIQFEKSYISNFSMRDVQPETKDGTRFKLMANIGLPAEASKAFKYGAEGIGLFRSEFLFLTSGEATDEEKQYKAYCQAAKMAGEHPVRIRTLDLGGDKILPAFFTKEDKNPLLGWRAIRFSLAMPELFKAQLRAILRAAHHGNIEIIFPLISCVEEFDQALGLLEEARAECREKGQRIAAKIKTGVMIEVPSAAIGADILAKKADFFSIGTNDLIQYTLAVDRGNEKVNYLAKATQPAVLRLIKMSIDAAHHEGKKASLCGELAGSPRFVPVLAGLGLDEFSMSASMIPEIKRVIRAVSLKGCRQLAEEALACANSPEVDKLLDDFNAKL